MRRRVSFALLAALAFPAAAQPTPPKLVITIVVDQLSADLFDEYRPHFTGGLARLAQGTVYRNGYQGQAATETCPGHSTILTGSLPARTGIIANEWIDFRLTRASKTVYCAEDERVPGSSSSRYTVSPRHLRVPTLGERMKARWPASRSVVVAGKDRSAVMLGGQAPDQRWYWQGKGFASDRQKSPPLSVTRSNAAVASAIAAPLPPLEPPPLCAARAGAEPAGRFARAAGDALAFRTSPEFDGAVLALAAGLVQELRLGRGAAPDLLAIGLSATDYVGHAYGSGGQEMCLQLLSLDRDLGDFLALLDRFGLAHAVVLTADHGAGDLPERLRRRGVAGATRIDPQLNPATIGRQVAARLGLRGPVLLGDAIGDVYVDRALRPADRVRALREAVALYRAHPQVEAVVTAAELKRTPLPVTSPDRWSLVERARASFDPERSGDLVVLLRRHVTARATGAGHGSAWDYDRRVPILFWRPGVPTTTREEAIGTVDILPTLAAMIGLPLAPAEIDGRCRPAAGAACPR